MMGFPLPVRPGRRRKLALLTTVELAIPQGADVDPDQPTLLRNTALLTIPTAYRPRLATTRALFAGVSWDQEEPDVPWPFGLLPLPLLRSRAAVPVTPFGWRIDS